MGGKGYYGVVKSIIECFNGNIDFNTRIGGKLQNYQS